MSETTIGFIGAGNMAYAISGKLDGYRIYVYDIHPESYRRFEERGGKGLSSVRELIECCEIVFLSVKPQNFEEVLQEISRVTGHEKCLYVTIAAGISTGYIASFLGADTRVVRAMPNTPLLLGCGCTALCKNERTSDEEFSKVYAIFQNSGYVQELPESKMNDVIAVNGSSPAYAYYFIEGMVDGAMKYGFDKETAKKLACYAVMGSVRMILETGTDTEELIKMVCSKGGTTERAMDALRENHFKEILVEAMKRCNDRAEEMSR